jgi:uncharacterized protein (TIGR03437 family)
MSSVARAAIGILLLTGMLCAQQYQIATAVGGTPPPTPVTAFGAAIGSPVGTATDAQGNVYFSSLNFCIFKVDQKGVLTRVAGNSRPGYRGDGGPALSAAIGYPAGVAIDRLGNLYIADRDNNRIRRVDLNGIITTVAGNGRPGYLGDGGPAAAAQLFNPYDVAVDNSGNLFIADWNNFRIRKVTPDGIITTVAGNGVSGFSGDGGPATNAQLSNPNNVALDALGNLYIADFFNSRIRKVSSAGVITTVAGTGTNGYSGDGGPATSAQLTYPSGLAIDASGNLYIADLYNSAIRKVSPAGVISTFAHINEPDGVAVDASGNLYVADPNRHYLWKVSPSGALTAAAGNGNFHAYTATGPVASAQLEVARSVAIDASGNIFVAELYAGIRKVSPDGTIRSLVGGGFVNTGVAVDATGNLYVAEWDQGVSKISPDGTAMPVVGNGTQGYLAAGVGVDSIGNLYIADWGNAVIRKVAPDGTLSTVAGNGTQGYSGDGGPATNAQLSHPYAVAVDASGNLYIVDSQNDRIRKVTPSGIIMTVAGGGTSGNRGDGGPATKARLRLPLGVAVDGQGNLYIVDFGNLCIRMVTASGTIVTIAGNGIQGYAGDGGPAVSAELYNPYMVAVDAAGDIYIADGSANAVRLLKPLTQPTVIAAVLDAASESVTPISPGKIIVIYGAGLGPSQLVQNQPSNGQFGTELSGTAVAVNGNPAPMIYTSATQVAAIVPYSVSGDIAQVTVSYNGQVSGAFSVPVAPVAPGLFTANQTGAGQLAAINVLGVPNDAAHPARVGDYLQLFATGEGQTSPSGIDGKLATVPYPAPNLSVRATVGGIPAIVSYAGAAPGEVAGLMQVNIQIPQGVQPGGSVPVVLTVGSASTVPGAVWIAVAGN